MAGHGPAPKDPAQRRNHHAPQRGEWVDLPPLDAPMLPELPDREDGWFESTREMWEAWQSDPVTSQWSPADVAFALQTIRLIDHPKAPPNEVRLRMDTLGLTPKGKRDLRWRIVEPMAAAPARKRPAAASGRRARLSVVPDQE